MIGDLIVFSSTIFIILVTIFMVGFVCYMTDKE